MSLAESREPPPAAVAGAPATAQGTSASHAESTMSADDSSAAPTVPATGTAAAGQDWTALTPEELRAARLARFG